MYCRMELPMAYPPAVTAAASAIKPAFDFATSLVIIDMDITAESSCPMTPAIAVFPNWPAIVLAWLKAIPSPFISCEVCLRFEATRLATGLVWSVPLKITSATLAIFFRFVRVGPLADQCDFNQQFPFIQRQFQNLGRQHPVARGQPVDVHQLAPVLQETSCAPPTRSW